MNMRILLVVPLALMLAACGAVHRPPPAEAPVETVAASDPWEAHKQLAPAEAWAKIAAYPIAEQPQLQLDLLSTWAQLGDWQTVRTYLDETLILAADTERFIALQQIRIQALIAGGRSDEAAALLDALGDDTTAWAFRAKIYQLLGDTGNTLRARLHIAAGQPEESARIDAYRPLWQGLLATPELQLQQWRETTTDSVWRGWLDLVLLVRPNEQAQIPVDEILDEWMLLYAAHPAAEWLPLAREAFSTLQVTLPVIAALLPLSGPSAHLGQAVREGIVERARLLTTEIPILRFYDTGDPATRIEDLYYQAVADGAERVIGPLQKTRVAELLELRELPVPIVSMNYLDTARPPPHGLLQFGLLPEDEVAQAAHRAAADGHRAALVFAPNTDWGLRLADSFARHFSEHEGTVAERTFYDPDASSYAEDIKAALKLADGERRRIRVEQVLGRTVLTRPSRRQDVDMVFLASSPRNARMIKPQIDYYYAEDLPIYATSHIYQGSPSPVLDQDLDRVRFCDVPLVFSAHPGVPATITPRTLPRLMALGADAVLLAYSLPLLEADPERRIEGWSGTLSLKDNERIYRELPWAQFRRGRPVLQK